MRSLKNLLLAGAVLGGTALIAAGPALADGWRGHGRFGGGMGLMESFDTNKDGKLTQAEIDAVRDQRRTQFDRDDNGALSLEEYQALWADAMRPRMVRQFQAHDADGNGSVTAEEFRARYADVVRNLDRNGDGELTADELRSRRDGDRGDRRGPPDRDDR